MIFSNRLALVLPLPLSLSLFSPLILSFIPSTYFSSSTSGFLAFHSPPPSRSLLLQSRADRQCLHITEMFISPLYCTIILLF